MPEITRPGGAPRQSIAPATTAPTAPTITAPGAPTATTPVSASSHRREQAMRKSFAETKERFGRSKYLSRDRKSKIRPTAAPATPISDAYIITMRPKDAAPKRREMLDDLVVREEQRKREDWLRAEEVRAAVLPHQLQAEIQYAAQVEYYNKVSQEHAKAVQERQARDAEAAKYGYSSYEALLQAIREEKAIKRANELGLALTEAQIIAQTVAREGYSGAAIQYGRDPGELIAEQEAKARAAQRSLRENFGVEMDPSHGDYLRDLSKFAAEQRQTSASIQQTAQSSGIVDQDTGLRIVSAGPPLKTSDYPSPPKGLNQSVARLTKNADGTGWNVEAGIVAPSPVPNADDRSELERTLQTHPFLLSPFGRLVQDIWDDRKEIAQAEVDAEEAYKRYEERRKAAEDAGLLVGDEFLISDPRSQIQFDELRISAEAATARAKEVEDLQKKELFGIPYKFNEWETGLAKSLNLPALSREQAFGLTRLQDPIISQIPVIAEFRAGVLYGAYSGIRDRPLTGLASFGIGLVGGAAVKGATMLPKAGKIVLPSLKLAEAAWVGSIGARTALSPDFFSAGETFGGIMTTEALPVAAGAAVVPRMRSVLPSARQMRIWAPDDALPGGVRMEAGWRPSEAMIEEGLPQVRAMRRGEDPVASLKTISSRYPSKSGRIVEVMPDVYIGREYLGQYEATLRYGTPSQKPIPPELLSAEDLVGIPRSLRAEVEIREPVFTERGLAGGWRPSEAMIEEGLPQLRAQRRGEDPIVSLKTLSSRHPSKSGRIVEIMPEIYIGREYLGQYEATLKYGTPSVKPIPPELLRPEDLVDVPKNLLGGARQSADPRHGAPVQKYYAGIPIRLPRPFRTPSRPHTSQSGRPLRIRPAKSGIRPDFSIARASVLGLGVVPAVTLGSDTRQVPIVSTSILSQIASDEALRQQMDEVQALRSDVAEVSKLDDDLAIMAAQRVDLRLDQVQTGVQIPRITRTPSPRIRPPRIRRPDPIRIRPPRVPTGWPEDPRRPSFGGEFYLHAADLPTPHARLEEAYTDLRDPKIRPAKVIRNLERITIGSPPRTPRRARTVQTATVRKTPHRVPWDIPAVRPLDVLGIPDLVLGPKRKKSRRRR